MKKSLIFFLFCLSFIASPIFSKETQFFKYPVLVFDQTERAARADLPNHYRVPLPQVSGSAEFNKTQLIYAMKNVKSPVYIIDLRQESHGFINDGIPISWYGKHDWLNKGLNTNKVEALEKKLLDDLSKQKSATFVFRNKKLKSLQNKDGLWGDFKILPINNVSSEQTLVESLGFHYERIAITDHMAPTDEELVRFLDFYRKLPPNVWLYFHCHGGDGRTTTFLAMTDILRNANKDSLNTILTRQRKLGGSDLINIDSTRKKWFTDAQKERFIFLQKFYDYVHSGNYAKSVNWS
jgi:hypothetical protein